MNGWLQILLIVNVIVLSTGISLSQSIEVYNPPENDYDSTSVVELSGILYEVSVNDIPGLIDGTADKTDTIFSEIVLIILIDGVEILKVFSPADYSVHLPVGYKYIIEYTHPDYIVKSLEIDTRDVPEFNHWCVLKTDMSMFKKNEAPKIAEPVSKAHYNTFTEDFVWEMNHYYELMRNYVGSLKE